MPSRNDFYMSDLAAKHNRRNNLDRMSNQKLKMTVGVWSAVAIGVIVPVYAVVFQQKKTASASIIHVIASPPQ
ncbi:hypothetical protein HAX54_001603 [Datura stramonium]|uniref:Uncharacterized protein n=1 Tax=Datura stramonium TaxID=4076 RepID=A0ABS8T3T7_DATST|nr:hypothetical protein [Datura stramonium]